MTDVLSTLKWLRKNNFRPVALHPKSKAAIDGRYTDPDYQPPGDELWCRQPNLNLGVATGPRAGGPIDVDLDCPESIYFAKVFLPETGAVFGRPSKPRSHYLYNFQCDSYKRLVFNDPVDGSVICEIRGDAHQTVMPGSTHETSGETISWSDVPFPETSVVANPSHFEEAAKKVAMATLVARHLWTEGQRNEICRHLAGMLYHYDWPQEEARTFIQAVMDFTGDTDRTRIRTIVATYQKGERGERVTGARSLKELVGDEKLISFISAWAGGSASPVVHEYNERFCCVQVEGKFRIIQDSVNSPIFFQKEDFTAMFGTDTILVEGKKISKARIWLADPRRRTYENVEFLPGVDDAAPIYNLWRGWGLSPSTEGSFGAWLELLRSVVCNGEDQLVNWMLHWFANILREPRRKPMTAPVLIGRQGAGKSLLFKYYGDILGKSYTVVTNPEHIHGKFNKHVATTLLLHSEEALYGGDVKHRAIIKSLITDSHIIYEPKGVDAKPISNYLRLALTSNETRAAPVERGDRRFTVIDMHDRKVPKDLLDRVLREMANGGPARLFRHLLDMDYDPEIPRVNVKNVALAEAKHLNFDPVDAWWYEVLCLGQLLPDYLWWAQDPPRASWPRVAAIPALAYSLRAATSGRRGEINSLVNRLARLLGGAKRGRHTFSNPMSDEAPQEVRIMSGKMFAFQDIPDLDTCRRLFNSHVGQELDYGEEQITDTRPEHDRF